MKKLVDFPIKQKVATTTKHPQTAIILRKMGQSLWFTCYFSWFYNILGFRLKTKKVYFSGLKNIAVHVTVRLASLCVVHFSNVIFIMIFDPFLSKNDVL